VDLASIAGLEAEWLTRPQAGRSGDAECYGWEPYSLAEFARLLDLAVPRVPVASCLGVGCGIGTKCLLAASRGLAVEGVERLPVLAAVARGLGVTVHEADARTWDGYGNYGIVYVNCPLKDEDAEAVLEARIRSLMAPGAVLISVNDCGAPPGWDAVADERDAFRGVYVKPGG